MKRPPVAPAGLPRVVDPLLVGAVALGVYTVHGFEGPLDRDLGTFVYGGQQFAHGVPPYVGIFNSVGPLGDALAGVGIRWGEIVGAGPVLSARAFYLLLSVGCVALLSVLAREVFGSRAVGFVAPAVFLTFQSFLDLATNGPREKTAMLLFLECALLLALRRRWFGAGLFVALATLTWQPVLAPATAAIAVALSLTPGRRWRGSAAFVLGGVVTTSLVAVYFLAEGALKVAVWGFVLVNVGYTDQPSVYDDPAGTWRLVDADYGGSLVVILAGLVLMVVLALAALLRIRRQDDDAPSSRDRAVLVVGAGAVVATAWTTYAVNGGPDLFVMLPFAALGVAGAVEAVTARLRATSARTTVVCVVVAATAWAGVESVSTRDTGLRLERRDIARVVAAAPPRATVLSVNAPEVLVILQRRNPLPWQLFNTAMTPFLDDHLPGGLTAYAARISRQRPTLIALGHHSVSAWLDPVLARDYWRVGRATGWTWYLSRTAGREALGRARAANASAIAAAAADLSVARAPGRVTRRD